MGDSLISIDAIRARSSVDDCGYARYMGIEPTEAWQGGCIVRLAVRSEFLRPGGVIAAPVTMGRADLSCDGDPAVASAGQGSYALPSTSIVTD